MSINNFRTIYFNTILVTTLSGCYGIANAQTSPYVSDLYPFIKCFSKDTKTTPSCVGFDFNNDGVINYSDLSVLARKFRPAFSADLNKDQLVVLGKNGADQAYFSACLGSIHPACSIADFNNDAVIDAADKVIFESNIEAASQADLNHDGVVSYQSPAQAIASIDTDGDGITDIDEQKWGLNPVDPADAMLDLDNDQLTNLEEINIYLSNPRIADTDNDTILDGNEVAYGLNPNSAADANLDPDRDFLTNVEEINIYASDPNKFDAGLAPDTDNDGLNDRLEVALSMDPDDAESNSVGLDTPEYKYILHTLNRLSYGPTNDLVSEVLQEDIGGWIEEQLVPTGLDEIPSDPAQVMRDTYLANFNQIEKVGAMRPMHSQHQLQTKMALFWDNHFNTSINATRSEEELWEEDQFFINAFGNFRKLLGISTKSFTMLRYLNLGTSKIPMPNENYAREVMELHTLGKTTDSGVYNASDVAALAKILSGWSWKRSNIPSRYRVFRSTVTQLNLFTFFFRPSWHDTNSKLFLGQMFPAGDGVNEGEHALDILATHPKTAEFICTKLAHYFISDTPLPDTIADCQNTFLDAVDDPDQIAQVLESLLGSEEFTRPSSYRGKFKDNLEYMVSLGRFLGVSAIGTTKSSDLYINTTSMGSRIAATGQRQFAKPEPTGWPETGNAWNSTNVALNRFREGNKLIFNNQLDLVNYFTDLGITTAGDILAHVFMIMLGSHYDISDMTMGYWVLHPEHKPFALTDPDAEKRLEGLVARVAQLPEFSNQ